MWMWKSVSFRFCFDLCGNAAVVVVDDVVVDVVVISMNSEI